jgi:uncharacterized protein YciI
MIKPKYYSAMFILTLTYTSDLEQVDQFLPGHNQFLQKYFENKMFICSGPKIPRTGGIILCQSESIENVIKIIEEDPFKIYGVANYEIIEFSVADCAKDFEMFQ